MSRYLQCFWKYQTCLDIQEVPDTQLPCRLFSHPQRPTEEYPSRTPFRLTLTRAFANVPSEPAIGHQTFLLLAPAEVFIRNVYLQPVALTWHENGGLIKDPDIKDF